MRPFRGMCRIVALACLAGVVAAVAAGSASASAARNFSGALDVTSQGVIPDGPDNELSFTGSGVVHGLGKVSVSGTEGEGCPEFFFCSKGFELTLTSQNGTTVQIAAGWREDCVPVLVNGEFRGEMFCPGQTRPDLVPMPTDIPITSLTGTGRFASLSGTGTVSWSAQTEYADFDNTYPGAAGTPITIFIDATLSRQ